MGWALSGPIGALFGAALGKAVSDLLSPDAPNVRTRRAAGGGPRITTETDFRASPRRNHRFATFSLVTSEKSMDIESWAGPSSLERAKTFFTGQFLNA